MNTYIKSLLSGVPEVLQYVLVLGIVMLILYVALLITRLLGQNHGEKQYFDDPEEYEKSVPDLFASTFLKRKPKQKENKKEDTDNE